MADFRLNTMILSTLVVVLLPGFIVYVCQSCSPPEGWRPPTLVDQILEAPNVLYGMVRNTFQDQFHSSAYTVELEVYCFLKGAATAELVINITGGGWIPGHCEASEYLASNEYIVRAHGNGKSGQAIQLTISGAHINATQEALMEIRKACGLNPVTRPSGSSSSAGIECPVSVADCQREPTPGVVGPIPPPQKDDDDAASPPKTEAKSDNPSSASAAIFTIATTICAAASASAAAALILIKSIE